MSFLVHSTTLWWLPLVRMLAWGQSQAPWTFKSCTQTILPHTVTHISVAKTTAPSEAPYGIGVSFDEIECYELSTFARIATYCEYISVGLTISALVRVASLISISPSMSVFHQFSFWFGMLENHGIGFLLGISFAQRRIQEIALSQDRIAPCHLPLDGNWSTQSKLDSLLVNITFIYYERLQVEGVKNISMTQSPLDSNTK